MCNRTLHAMLFSAMHEAFFPFFFVKAGHTMRCYVAGSAWLLVAFILSACGGASNDTDTSGGGLTVTVPGAPTGVTAVAGDATATVSFSAPSSNGGAAISSYTASCRSGTSTALTATGSASPLSVSGLTNGLSYACSVVATNSAGNSLASTSVAVTPIAPSSGAKVDYSTPAPFVTAVQASYTPPALARASTLSNRGRYLMSDSSTGASDANFLTIVEPYNAATGYSATAEKITTANASYQNFLAKLVQLVAQSDGIYRLDSHLHPNNSIDARAEDSYQLKFRNNFGKVSTSYGYVTFSYDSNTQKLQAKNRYLYTLTVANSTGTASYAVDTKFAASGYYVKLSGTNFTLVASAADATPLYFFNSPLSLGIPTFMNPKSEPFVTNAAAPFKINDRAATLLSSITGSVSATYKGQISSVGSDATTKTNADDLLASIKTAVDASGESLRYAPALYSAFRDGALRTKLVSDTIADGTPGQHMVPYVYFTNEKDAAGKYHPFMIVVSYGNQSSPNGLKDIARPPGDGLTSSYGTQAVTRFSNLEAYITAIPMKNYGQVSAVTANTLTRSLWSDVSGAVNGRSVSKDVYSYADTADNGLLIDGSVMFPIFNNMLMPSHLLGELSASGCHVGRGGGGPHCHADGYQSGYALALYNDSDYLNKTHPPLIGFGYDGIALFGIYRSSDTAMLGSNTPLDGFGAHDHDGIGYHYHAHTVPDYQPDASADSKDKSTMHVLMKGAYIGKTESIPFFRQNSSFNNNKYLGGTVAPGN